MCFWRNSRSKVSPAVSRDPIHFVMPPGETIPS